MNQIRCFSSISNYYNDYLNIIKNSSYKLKAPLLIVALLTMYYAYKVFSSLIWQRSARREEPIQNAAINLTPLHTHPSHHFNTHLIEGPELKDTEDPQIYWGDNSDFYKQRPHLTRKLDLIITKAQNPHKVEVCYHIDRPIQAIITTLFRQTHILRSLPKDILLRLEKFVEKKHYYPLFHSRLTGNNALDGKCKKAWDSASSSLSSLNANYLVGIFDSDNRLIAYWSPNGNGIAKVKKLVANREGNLFAQINLDNSLIFYNKRKVLKKINNYSGDIKGAIWISQNELDHFILIYTSYFNKNRESLLTSRRYDFICSEDSISFDKSFIETSPREHIHSLSDYALDKDYLSLLDDVLTS